MSKNSKRLDFGFGCVQAARKPNFVLDDHSSRPDLTIWLKQPTRRFRLLASFRKPALHDPERDGPSRARRIRGCGETPCLFGLAPCGVYQAVDVTANAVGSYPTVSPLPQAANMGGASCEAKPNSLRRFVFCCTGRPAGLYQPSRTLSGTLPCGVRTFLPFPTRFGLKLKDKPRGKQRSSSRLHRNKCSSRSHHGSAEPSAFVPRRSQRKRAPAPGYTRRVGPSVDPA
jgi:hypothetical protein